MTRSPRRGAALMVASAAFWAGGTVLSKAVLDETAVDPLPLLTVQLTASVIALLAVAAVRRQPVRPAMRVGWTGLLEPGAAYLLGTLGLALTTATSATVLGSLEPVMVPFLAWAVLGTRPDGRRVALVVVAAAGALAVSWDGGGAGSATGDLLVFGGVVAAALYVVVSARHVATHAPTGLAAAQQAWALGLTVLVTGATAAISGWQTWPSGPGGMTAAAATGVCQYAIPFTLYLAALRHLHVTDAAAYLCLIPVIGVAGATTLLGEPITARQLIGAAAVVWALLVAARTGRAAVPATGAAATPAMVTGSDAGRAGSLVRPCPPPRSP